MRHAIAASARVRLGSRRLARAQSYASEVVPATLRMKRSRLRKGTAVTHASGLVGEVEQDARPAELPKGNREYRRASEGAEDDREHPMDGPRHRDYARAVHRRRVALEVIQGRRTIYKLAMARAAAWNASNQVSQSFGQFIQKKCTQCHEPRTNECNRPQ